MSSNTRHVTRVLAVADCQITRQRVAQSDAIGATEPAKGEYGILDDSDEFDTECRYCDGTGKYYFGYYEPPSNCHHCYGTGRIYRP